MLSITVAGQSEARNVFACSSTGIVVSNPTRGMDVCLRYSVFVLSCVASETNPVEGQWLEEKLKIEKLYKF
jgi:hypothetical protein